MSMVDCHIHMILDGDWWKTAIARHSSGPDIPWIRSILAAYQQAGFTWLRDGGDRWGAGAAARSLAPEYGITYRTPLAPLCMEGHYGSFIGCTYSNLKESMSRVGRCIDNGPMESFWGMLKSEMYYLRRFTDKDTLTQAIENYIHFYNNGRFQKRLRCMTPMEFHCAYAA